MPNRRNKKRQNSASERQATVGGRQDTSQTTGGLRFGAADSTFDSSYDDEVEEFSVSPGGRKRQGDPATIWGTIGTWLGIGVSLVAALVGVAWYASKVDSSLTNVQSDVKDVKVKIERLAADSAKHAGRLDRIEGSMSGLESTLRSLSSKDRGESKRARP